MAHPGAKHTKRPNCPGAPPSRSPHVRTPSPPRGRQGAPAVDATAGRTLHFHHSLVRLEGINVIYARVTPKTKELLRFRCTGCGNCCKEPLLPLTAGDVRRISEHTGDKPKDFIRWVDRHAIEMDDEPEGFVVLRQGK